VADERKKRETRTPEGGVNIDLGLGGLFKGLGNFIDLLSEMVEEGESEITRQGEFKIKGLEKARGVYGFTVKTGLSGIPRVESFGNIRETERGPIVTETREPLVDIFDEGEIIVVVAELPGVGEEEIEIEIQDDLLSLSTKGERKYVKEMLLPHLVDSATLTTSYKNGILELRVNKAKGG
jgi:HSP20 family protein